MQTPTSVTLPHLYSTSPLTCSLRISLKTSFNEGQDAVVDAVREVDALVSDGVVPELVVNQAKRDLTQAALAGICFAPQGALLLHLYCPRSRAREMESSLLGAEAEAFFSPCSG